MTLLMALRRQNRWLVFLLTLAMLAGCGTDLSADRAKTLIESGQIDEAIEMLRERIDQDPDDSEIQYLYGVALGLAGQISLAEWPLRKAMRDPEWTQSAGILVAQNAIQSQNAEAAIPPLDEILDRDPENVAALLLRASAYAATKVRIDEAIADVELIREIDPENVESFRPEILAYLAAARSEEAQEALETMGALIEESRPDDELHAWYCTTMAIFAQESRETAEAEERFETCLEEHPANLSTVAAALDFFDSQNRRQRSLEILERAIIETNPEKFVGLRSNLAFRLASMGRYEKSIELLRSGARAGSDLDAAKFASDLATLFDQLGRTEEALESYEDALRLTRSAGYENPLQDYSVADLAIRAGDLERAGEIAQSLTVPAFQEMILARVAQEQNHHEEALRRYDEAARLWPHNEYARYHAARSAEALGEFDRAIELYRHAMRISRETTNAANRIAILRIAEGDPVAAFELLQIHRSRTPLDAQGELLAMELGARLGDLAGLSNRIQQAIERRSAPPPLVLASAFRGLRMRDAPDRALDLLPSIRPEVFAMTGGASALIEIARNAAALQQLDRVAPLFEAAAQTQPEAGEWIAAQGYLRELQGREKEAGEHYARALQTDSEQPEALLGLARITIKDDPSEAARLAQRALASAVQDATRREQIEEVGVRIQEAGQTREALELFTALLDQVPHSGKAAAALASHRMLRGDHSDGTLDLARRAARFFRSHEAVALLEAVEATRASNAPDKQARQTPAPASQRD